MIEKSSAIDAARKVLDSYGLAGKKIRSVKFYEATVDPNGIESLSAYWEVSFERYETNQSEFAVDPRIAVIVDSESGVRELLKSL